MYLNELALQWRSLTSKLIEMTTLFVIGGLDFKCCLEYTINLAVHFSHGMNIIAYRDRWRMHARVSLET